MLESLSITVSLAQPSPITVSADLGMGLRGGLCLLV